MKMGKADVTPSALNYYPRDVRSQNHTAPSYGVALPSIETKIDSNPAPSAYNPKDTSLILSFWLNFLGSMRLNNSSAARASPPKYSLRPRTKPAYPDSVQYHIGMSCIIFCSHVFSHLQHP
jgi:hypothetical protein